MICQVLYENKSKKETYRKPVFSLTEVFQKNSWVALMQLKPPQSKATQEMKSLPQYPSLAHSNYAFLPGLLLFVH